VEGVHVTNIDLGYNDLKGTIPSDIGEFSKLTELQLDSKYVTGEIPEEVYGLSELEILNFSRNQLTGSISSAISNLTMLRKFNIYNNQLDGLPDLSSLNNLEFLNIKENQFTFEDIEPNIGVSSGSFYYSPQAMIGEVVSLAPNPGAPVELSVSVGGEQNVYQWYKDGSPVANSDTSVFTIQTFDSDSAGIYNCEITNNLATSLTLETKNMYVDVPITNYTISLNTDPSGGGIVNGEGTYEDGETVTVNASPNVGYAFDVWDDGEDYLSHDTIYSFEANTDLTLTAVFEPLPSFAISSIVEPEGSGSVNGAKDYYKDETATLEAIAESGFEFVNWKESDTVVSTETSFTFNVERARSFLASFEESISTISENRETLRLFPNPSAGHFHVQGVTGRAKLFVYDMMGKLVTKHVISDNDTVYLRNLSPGLYIVSIQQDNQTIFNQIIIKQ